MGRNNIEADYIYIQLICLENTNKYSGRFHLGSRSQTYAYARKLRQTSTEAEQKLWTLLRNRQIKGKKFRRQHALADYIADFYCHECKLVIELDGQFHKPEDAKQYDEARTRLLKEYDIRVLRFWNAEVLQETEKVLEKIASFL